MSEQPNLDRTKAAMKLALFTLKKIAHDSSKDGQMIRAYQMLAQVTLKQMEDILYPPQEGEEFLVD